MKKIILDADTGVDDTLAIAYLCAKENVEVLGVTTVYGNTSVDQATRNTHHVLSLFKQDIPVYQGAHHAFHKEAYSQQRGGAVFHGTNGLGDVEVSDRTVSASIEHASDYMIRITQEFPNELTLVATGPLTNIAVALNKNPKAMSLLKRIVLMGGAFGVSGNVSPYAEANISQDPEAARIVFESNINITMVGLDVTSRSIIKRSDISHWQIMNDGSKEVYAIQDHYFKAHELIYPQWGGAAMHDALAAIVAVDESLVSTLNVPITVLESKEQFGRTVLDLGKMEDSNLHNVAVAYNLDVDAFRHELIKSIDNLLSRL